MSNKQADTEQLDRDQIPQDPTSTQNLFTPERLRFNNADQQFEVLFPGQAIDYRLEGSVLYTIDEKSQTAIVVYPPGGIPTNRADLMIKSYEKLLEYSEKHGLTMMSYQPHDATIPAGFNYGKVPLEAMKLATHMVKNFFKNRVIARKVERMVVVTTSRNVGNKLGVFSDTMVVVDSNNPMDGLDFITKYKSALTNPEDTLETPEMTYARIMLESPVTILSPQRMIRYYKNNVRPQEIENVLDDEA